MKPSCSGWGPPWTRIFTISFAPRAWGSSDALFLRFLWIILTYIYRPRGDRRKELNLVYPAVLLYLGHQQFPITINISIFPSYDRKAIFHFIYIYIFSALPRIVLFGTPLFAFNPCDSRCLMPPSLLPPLMAFPTNFSSFPGSGSNIGSRTHTASSEPEPWSRHRSAQMQCT